MKHLSFRRGIRRYFDIPRWIGAEHIGSQFRNIKAMMQSMTNPPPPEREETFKQAIKRLNMTQEDLEERQKNLFLMACIYFTLAIIIIGYGLFLLYAKKWMAMLMCIPIAAVLLSFAFREHFWFTQLKHKRLGFTFKDWWKAFLGSA